MLKIGVLDGDKGKGAAAKEMLQGLVANLSVEICDDVFQRLDILIINRAPFGDGISPCLLSPKIIVANSDDKHVLHFVSSMEAQIITYGLNPKAAVTASSHVDDDCYVICIQRAMATIDDAPILPREFGVNAFKGCEGFDESMMGAITAALICGVNFE
jgi:hypothetical protein